MGSDQLSQLTKTVQGQKLRMNAVILMSQRAALGHCVTILHSSEGPSFIQRTQWCPKLAEQGGHIARAI